MSQGASCGGPGLLASPILCPRSPQRAASLALRAGSCRRCGPAAAAGNSRPRPGGAELPPEPVRWGAGAPGTPRRVAAATSAPAAGCCLLVSAWGRNSPWLLPLPQRTPAAGNCAALGAGAAPVRCLAGSAAALCACSLRAVAGSAPEACPARAAGWDSAASSPLAGAWASPTRTPRYPHVRCRRVPCRPPWTSGLLPLLAQSVPPMAGLRRSSTNCLPHQLPWLTARLLSWQHLLRMTGRLPPVQQLSGQQPSALGACAWNCARLSRAASAAASAAAAAVHLPAAPGDLGAMMSARVHAQECVQTALGQACHCTRPSANTSEGSNLLLAVTVPIQLLIWSPRAASAICCSRLRGAACSPPALLPPQLSCRRCLPPWPPRRDPQWCSQPG